MVRTVPHRECHRRGLHRRPARTFLPDRNERRIRIDTKTVRESSHLLIVASCLIQDTDYLLDP